MSNPFDAPTSVPRPTPRTPKPESRPPETLASHTPENAARANGPKKPEAPKTWTKEEVALIRERRAALEQQVRELDIEMLDALHSQKKEHFPDFAEPIKIPNIIRGYPNIGETTLFRQLNEFFQDLIEYAVDQDKKQDMGHSLQRFLESRINAFLKIQSEELVPKHDKDDEQSYYDFRSISVNPAVSHEPGEKVHVSLMDEIIFTYEPYDARYPDHHRRQEFDNEALKRGLNALILRYLPFAKRAEAK